MNENKSKNTPQVILAPLTGKAVLLSEVPDPVFSEKVLGDGVAIIPADGKIVSPVDGEISTVAETSHAYGFTSEDGQEVLVHVGLETVSLDGECFKVYGKAGDKVKAGDLVAEVDLQYIEGDVKAGESEVLVLTEKNVKAEEIDGWREADGRSKDAENEKRLDYIFCNTQADVRTSNVICNGKNAPVVSDHYGVMITV